MYTVKLSEADIRKVRNILEFKAFELEETKDPNAEEVDRLAIIFDNVLRDIRNEKELEIAT